MYTAFLKDGSVKRRKYPRGGLRARDGLDGAQDEACVDDHRACFLRRPKRHGLEQALQHHVQPPRADVGLLVVEPVRERRDLFDAVVRERQVYAVRREQRLILLRQRVPRLRKNTRELAPRRAERASRATESDPGAPASGLPDAPRGTRLPR